MNNNNMAKILKIQSYKHNGLIYRNWDNTLLLDNNVDYLVCANNHAKVTEVDGRVWSTKEPAIIFFFKDKWYNVIAQFKKNGIYYYCNMASPYILESSTIKYVDYDLDLRIFPNRSFIVLDKIEYKIHKQNMRYGDEIDKIIKFELSNLIDLYKKKEGPFNNKILYNYYEMYLNLSENVKA